ncbi:hypothetical protein BDZ89DRAFT_1044543 [Hymenopellis radicata]|nr:hypothetical protein BDZ89DRAFT_1044543 [Hymenopellis radicata]
MPSLVAEPINYYTVSTAYSLELPYLDAPAIGGSKNFLFGPLAPSKTGIHLVISVNLVIVCLIFARITRSFRPKSSKLSLVTDDTSSPFPPYAVSKKEATSYYEGISPTPQSWSTGKLKQAHGVFKHKLNAVWKDVGPLVRDILNSYNIFWTSIDVARFFTYRDTNEKICGLVVIWIGVHPASQGEDTFRSSNEILALLVGFDIRVCHGSGKTADIRHPIPDSIRRSDRKNTI